MAMRSVLPMTRVQRYHGSASVIERERKGQSTWFSVGDLPFSRIAGSRVFTPSELYEVYRLCPDIRAPIDLISLRVAQTPWVVAPKANLKKGTRQWLKARALAAHPIVQAGILYGEVEQSMLWKDEETGLWCRARPERRW